MTVVVCRHGKDGKQQSVPLPSRRAKQEYLGCRPLVEVRRVLLGERGPLTDRGVRALCDKFASITKIELHPHLLRHTFAHQFSADTGSDLVGLAQILGHESLKTTAQCTRQSEHQFAQVSDWLAYGPLPDRGRTLERGRGRWQQKTATSV